MKTLKIIAITIIGIFASPSLWAVDCTFLPNTTLNTQAQVDSFQADFGPCDTVLGNLQIRNGSITDLSPLAGITNVNGLLLLFNLDSLANLNGLDNITSIGELDIDDNQLITNLAGLSGLTTINQDDIRVADNPNLTSLVGLENLTQINGLAGEIRIDLNPQLVTLSALSNLQTGLNLLSISRNDLLTDLTGLSGLKGSIIRLSVTNNIGLQNLNGLGTINSISTDLNIYGNTQLVDVSVLSGLTTIGEDFEVEDTLLTNLDDFINLNSLSGRLEVRNNPNLQNIDGLSSLSGTLDGFRISDNNVLENVDGNLNLQNNPMLSDCSAVVTLVDANDDFAVGPGPGGAGAPDIAGNVSINGNLTNCNSVQEILDSATILYVDVNTIADSSCAIGACWNHAYPNLQDALAVATSGTNLWLAQGVYYPDVGDNQTDNDREATFTLIKGASLYGGFNGTETDFSQRDVAANVTILSGDIDGNDNNADGNFIAEAVGDISGFNSLTIATSPNGDNNTHLDGVTITANNSFQGAAGYNGGSMFCINGRSTVGIRQVVFIGNRSESNGGAMHGCAQNVNHSSFINNNAGTTIDQGKGGSIFSFGGTIKNSEFISNTASQIGGAIRNSTATLRVVNTKFMGNSIPNNIFANRGGAIWSSSDVFIENSLFSGNKAGNQSNDHGGALFLNGSSNAQLINVTFTGNRAGGSGGAIGSTSSGMLTLDNTIIWNNQDTSGLGTATASISHPNGTTLINNSLVQAFDTSGTSNLDEDPLFVLDTDPTTAPTLVGDARLTELSMAIDTGNNSVVTTNTDLDGNSRIFSTTVDMGAYEFFVEEEIFKDGFE